MTKANTRKEKAACDRCRGQKLRCIWDPKEPQCQRCARANAVCTVPLPRPMGRPPRRHRTASSSCHSRGQTQSLPESPSEENPAATVSGDDMEDTHMALSSVNVLSDPLDFLPWFPEPDGLNLFAPRGPLTGITAPVMPNSSTVIGGSRLFSPQSELFTQTLSNPLGGKPVEADPSNHPGLDNADHMHFQVTTAEEAGDNQVQLLTQLCELNVALFQHPLHREKDKTAPSDAQPADNPSTNTPGMNVSDLRTGSLFEMTCRLKDIVMRIRAQSGVDGSAPQGGGSGGRPERNYYDRPTALMALSCYTRLDVLYSRALEILVRVRNNGVVPGLTMMPELVIDGFSMGACLDLQLGFLIQLHEQARDRIRACIRSAEGTTRVARSRGG
ncbi:hypothetical protein C8A01DRAFT_20668 [Parachaetomium inaequale]|uniref:Zn(2)-C6 fungal-type domain-containing protein n=1 Tax=Parachaetomium inaequale TaxID=2588326 RepID=A0AAN6SM64_9PEZI|nr:hypothetical protein C8A01DRAFT_20668 [Parachaetomium inaequale]